MPADVLKYRVGYLKASPWVGARPVLGTAPTVSRVGAPQVLGWVPLSLQLRRLGKGPVRFYRDPLYPSLTRLGLVLQRESGVRSTRHPSYSPPLFRLVEASLGVGPCEPTLPQRPGPPRLELEPLKDTLLH